MGGSDDLLDDPTKARFLRSQWAPENIEDLHIERWYVVVISFRRFKRLILLQYENLSSPSRYRRLLRRRPREEEEKVS
jgi:hypothetical protein